MRVAVIGGGWAGIAAAVRAVEAGHDVTLSEMAPQLGGRARSIELDGAELDNGQHILIGAYSRTLALMRTVGVEPDAVLQRLSLDLTFADGRGMRLTPGRPVPALLRAVCRRAGWSVGERAALLRAAAGWAMRGFRCDPAWTVAGLTEHLPAALRRDLVDPLCVAALNTPADEASATVFLRVLRDALFAGAGSSDLLLPRAPLDRLLPAPAAAWLERRGASLRRRRRVQTLTAHDGGWAVDGEPADAVILACTAHEAGRLTRDVAPAWSDAALAFEHAPIVTVYLRSEGTRLPRPMTALHDGPGAPAQFLFDHGALGMTPGLFAAVVSGAARWVQRGLDATAEAVRQQVGAELAAHWRAPPTVWRTVAERRATFACRPQLRRPPTRVAERLWAAGDYVEGPYPSTLEGAVRAGETAAAEATCRH